MVPACPAQDGCVPGAITAQTLTLPSAIVALRHPDTLREERLKQLDLKLAKNFRLRGISIAPSFEMFNILNSDKVLTRVSTSYANAAGTFRQPNSVMEGRIIGARVMVRW